MADEPEVVEDVLPEQRRSMVLPLVGVGVAALALGIGGGYALFGSSGAAESAEATEAGGDAGATGASPIAAIVPSTQVVELGSFTINLRDSAGGRILQMDLAVECGADGGDLVKSREAQLRDAIIMLASDYSYLELDGTDGRLRLRDESHRRINAVLAPQKCNRVYFTKFVVQ